MDRVRVPLVAGALLAVFGASFASSRALSSRSPEPGTPTVTLPAAVELPSPTIHRVSLTGSIPALKQLPNVATSSSGGAADPSSSGGTTTPAGNGGSGAADDGSTIQSSG
jgi:hypothetical protein